MTPVLMTSQSLVDTVVLVSPFQTGLCFETCPPLISLSVWGEMRVGMLIWTDRWWMEFDKNGKRWGNEYRKENRLTVDWRCHGYRHISLFSLSLSWFFHVKSCQRFGSFWTKSLCRLDGLWKCVGAQVHDGSWRRHEADYGNAMGWNWGVSLLLGDLESLIADRLTFSGRQSVGLSLNIPVKCLCGSVEWKHLPYLKMSEPREYTLPAQPQAPIDIHEVQAEGWSRKQVQNQHEC